jgi:hypothetical protein
MYGNYGSFFGDPSADIEAGRIPHVVAVGLERYA